MMTSSPITLLFLYLTIVGTSLLLRDKKFYILGTALIGVCLLFLDLPDIAEYKYHYQLVGEIGYKNVLLQYNFEPGYVALITITSKLMPFEVFYVIIITLTLHAYLKFYCKNTGNLSYIYAVLFLSICLYFVAFTIRTTMASLFLAYALLCLQNKKNALAALLIFTGATFQIVIAPMIILPVLNYFSAHIAKRYLFIYAFAICCTLFTSKLFSMESLLGLHEFVDLKILSYKDDNIPSENIYFGLWIIAALGSIISFRHFNEFDRVLMIALMAIILFMYPYEFVQGRFMWLTSFIFIYVLAKGTLLRLELGKTVRLLLVMTLPLATLLRF